jgi:hypothetical protein
MPVTRMSGYNAAIVFAVASPDPKALTTARASLSLSTPLMPNMEHSSKFVPNLDESTCSHSRHRSLMNEVAIYLSLEARRSRGRVVEN